MSKNINSFQSFNDRQSQRYLADHFPHGKMFGYRHDSNSVIYKFIMSIATWIKIFMGDLFLLVKNRDISKTDELLEEWETAVKIPEEIPKLDTIEQRRVAVERLISKTPVYNIDDGIAGEKTTLENYIFCLTGIEVTITTSRTSVSDPASSDLVLIVGVEGTYRPLQNAFVISFPIQFFTPQIADATIKLLDLVLERVVPAFCRWEYEEIF